METKTFLRMIDRKAIFAGIYLLIAVAFFLTWLYCWCLDPLSYSRNGLSPVSLVDDMLDPFAGILMLATSIIYGIHFYYGSFYYPYKYRNDIRMDIELANPESNKVMDDLSISRGLFICVAWIVIFFLAFYHVFSFLILALITISWLSLHIVLIVLTSTSSVFTLVRQTIDATIAMPEEYTEDKKGKHKHMELSFFIPASVDEFVWSEKYLKEYVKFKKNKWNDGITKNQEIKDLSEKLAKVV